MEPGIARIVSTSGLVAVGLFMPLLAGCQSFTSTMINPPSHDAPAGVTSERPVLARSGDGSQPVPRPEPATDAAPETSIARLQAEATAMPVAAASRPVPNASSLALGFGDRGLSSEVAAYDRAIASELPFEPVRSLGGSQSPNSVQVTYTFEGADFDPDISRDGSFLVYASTQHRPTADIYLKRVGSSVVTQLTNDSSQNAMPSISPDGSRVAFCSDRSGNWDIYVMSTKGGPAVQITSDGANDLHPSWSPDGMRMAFSRLGQTSGRWEMWVVDARYPEVAEFVGYGLFPQWCPSAGTGEGGSDRLLFQRGRERGDGAFGLWTLDYKDGQVSNLTQLIASPLAAFVQASWAPDGTHVVYAAVPTPSEWSDPDSGRPDAATLWMMSVDGGSRVALTGGDALDLMPTWGPDNRIYFISDRSGTDNIWSMDLTPAILAATGRTAPSRSVITGTGVRRVPLGTADGQIVSVPDND
jgi:Tol biopolymer transport system component